MPSWPGFPYNPRRESSMSVTRRWAGWIAAGLVGCVTVTALQSQQPVTKVTDATLLKPADGDWVGYGRDYAETHHSPLKQIDQSSVGKLAEAWSVEVGSDGKL